MQKTIYFVLPIFLFVISDLLGTIVVNKHNLNSLKYNSWFGFAIIMGLYYVYIFILVCLDVKFIILYILSLIFFLGIIIYIIINYKKYYTKPQFDCYFIIVIVFTAFQLICASQNSIGSLMRYDTVTYGNLISWSIYGPNINYLDYSNGYYAGLYTGYSFQGYYRLASVLYYTINFICNRLGIEFFFFTQHTWMYSIVLYIFYSQLIVNFINYFKTNNKFQIIFILLFFLLFIGNYYWNSEQAYLGNSFRILFCSYSLLLLEQYINKKEIKQLISISIINLAQCSCACCNTSLVIIFMFFVFVYICNNKQDHNIVFIGCFIPGLNLLFYIIGFSWVLIAIYTVAFIILFFILPILNKSISNKIKIKHLLPPIVLLIMIILSYNITHNLFDFSAFTNNMSGVSDMTWDYTDFSSPYRFIGNVLYIILFITALITNRHNKLMQLIIYIILFFFNPFAMAIQNKYMIVFYRNYDIVLNYFSLFAGLKAVEIFLRKEKLISVSFSILSLLALYAGIKEYLYHPDDGFPINQKYDIVLHMNKDEAEAISFMKYYLKENSIEDTKVISDIYQLRCDIPNVKTLFSRSKAFNNIESERDLYNMFYPADYYGDPYRPANIKWDDMDKLVKQSKYSFIINKKDNIAYINDNNYMTVSDLLYNCGYSPIYENDSFIIYETGY